MYPPEDDGFQQRGRSPVLTGGGRPMPWVHRLARARLRRLEDTAEQLVPLERLSAGSADAEIEEAFHRAHI